MVFGRGKDRVQCDLEGGRFGYGWRVRLRQQPYNGMGEFLRDIFGENIKGREESIQRVEKILDSDILSSTHCSSMGLFFGFVMVLTWSVCLCLARNILLIHPGALRIRLNPALHYFENLPIETSSEEKGKLLPLVYLPSDMENREDYLSQVENEIKRLSLSEGKYLPLSVVETSQELILNLRTAPSTLFFCKDTFQSCMNDLEKIFDDEKIENVTFVGVKDSFINMDSTTSSSSSSSSVNFLSVNEYMTSTLLFPQFKSMYDNILTLPAVKEIMIEPKILKGSESKSISAQFLLQEYLRLEEEQFVSKYGGAYIEETSTSIEHRRSLERLQASNSFFDGKPSSSLPSLAFSLFLYILTILLKHYMIHVYVMDVGEVFTGLFSPKLALGLISPLDIIQTVLSSSSSFWPFRQPKTDLIKDLLIRHHWHRQIASTSLQLQGAEHDKFKTWDAEFVYWNGYLQRQAVYIPKEDADIKTIFICLHGFGGSLDQFTSLAEELCKRDETSMVAALDLLGFGQSEKPPISYDQYLWRDQVVDFIKNIRNKYGSDKKIVLAGNSIGKSPYFFLFFFFSVIHLFSFLNVVYILRWLYHNRSCC